MIRFSSCMAPSMEGMCREIARLAVRRLGFATRFVGDVDWRMRERRFMAGRIDVLWLCGLPYVWNWRERPDDVRLLAAPVMRSPRYGGRPVYYSDIVVRRGSGFASFDDLRGSRFAYNEPRSHSGYNVMRFHLAERGETSGFFAAARESGAHQRSMAWIVSGEADAAAVDSTVLELEFERRPSLRESLDVIDSLGPSPMPPWLARAGLDPGVCRAVRDLLLSLHEDVEGRAILASCRIERFAAVTDDHYDPIRRMAERAAGVTL